MSSVVYSPLCDHDKDLYRSYLCAIAQNGSAHVFACGVDGSGCQSRCHGGGDNHASSPQLGNAVQYFPQRFCYAVCGDRDDCHVCTQSLVNCSFEGARRNTKPVEGLSSNNADSRVSGVCDLNGDDGVSKSLGGGFDDSKTDGRSVGLGSGQEKKVAGKWAASNRKRKERNKAKKLSSLSDWRKNAVPVGVNDSVDERVRVHGGFCETVVSQQPVSPASACPSYGQALSDAEREARDTLAQRRAAENKVAKKLAEMKLASLEDEKKCREYADLRRSRIIQWTNEATAKSQQSLEKCKSIDPSSSASQEDIRQQAKENADIKAENYRLTMAIRTSCDDWKEILESCRPVQDSMDTELIEELAEFGLPGNDEPSRPTSPDMFDAIIAKKNAAVRAKLAKVDMKARLAAEEERKLDSFFA